MKNNSLTSEKYNPWLKYTGLASQILVMVGLAVYGGIKLDEKYRISPLLTILLPLLALGLTFYQIIKETTKNRNNEHKKQK